MCVVVALILMVKKTDTRLVPHDPRAALRSAERCPVRQVRLQGGCCPGVAAALGHIADFISHSWRAAKRGGQPPPGHPSTSWGTRLTLTARPTQLPAGTFLFCSTFPFSTMTGEGDGFRALLADAVRLNSGVRNEPCWKKRSRERAMPALSNPSHSLQPMPIPGAPAPRSQLSWRWRRCGPSATCRWPAGSSRSRPSACPSCGRPSPAAPPSPPAWGRLSSLQGQQGHCQARAPLDPPGCPGKGQAPPGAGAEPLCGPTDEDIQPIPSPFPLGQRQGVLGPGKIPAPELGAHLRPLRAGSPAPES